MATLRAFAAPAGWQSRPSPNFGARPSGAAGRVSAIVLHADASPDVAATLDWCGRATSQVSYHLLVGRTGFIYLLVSPDRRAWHAGVSALAGVGDCNDYSVGVCLSNDNRGEPYPERQLAAAAVVCARVARHYGVALDRLVRHADVALPAGRKTDPAKPFDLASFRVRVQRALDSLTLAETFR